MRVLGIRVGRGVRIFGGGDSGLLTLALGLRFLVQGLGLPGPQKYVEL